MMMKGTARGGGIGAWPWSWCVYRGIAGGTSSSSEAREIRRTLCVADMVRRTLGVADMVVGVATSVAVGRKMCGLMLR